jgi:hypothetical protein
MMWFRNVRHWIDTYLTAAESAAAKFGLDEQKALKMLPISRKLGVEILDGADIQNSQRISIETKMLVYMTRCWKLATANEPHDELREGLERFAK